MNRFKLIRGTLIVALFLCSFNGYGQKHLLSYDDFKYLLQNNLHRADTFMVVKGYSITQPAKGFKKREYQIKTGDGSITTVQIVIEGRKVTLNVETREPLQYDVIKDSIAQYGYSSTIMGDMLVYRVKDLGDLYVMVRELEPYSPIKKDYSITLRGEKELTVLN